MTDGCRPLSPFLLSIGGSEFVAVKCGMVQPPQNWRWFSPCKTGGLLLQLDRRCQVLRTETRLTQDVTSRRHWDRATTLKHFRTSPHIASASNRVTEAFHWTAAVVFQVGQRVHERQWSWFLLRSLAPRLLMPTFSLRPEWGRPIDPRFPLLERRWMQRLDRPCVPTYYTVPAVLWKHKPHRTYVWSRIRAN